REPILPWRSATRSSCCAASRSTAIRSTGPRSSSSAIEARSRLFERLPVPLQPSSRMPARRVVMRPVQDSAFRVPDIFAAELDHVSLAQGFDALCEIDVVRDQNRKAADVEEKALMTRTLRVVAEQLRHSSRSVDGHV